MNKNTISLMKGFVLAEDAGVDNRIAVSTLQSNLMQYGYMLDENAFEALGKSDLAFIKNLNDDLVNFVRVALGGKFNYKPFYNNFPLDMMSRSHSELFLNQLKHYWADGTWLPESKEFENSVAFENVKYTTLTLGTNERFTKIFTDLVSLNTSLTPYDLGIVKWFVINNEKLVFPATIPFKENLCTLAAMGVPGVPVKTTTDVLRIAVHMSGGDISLPSVPGKTIRGRWGRVEENTERANFKFKKFTRSERRLILSLLEKTNCDISEMVLRDQRWIRLGEILHPGEYAHQYPRAFAAFKKIRNEKVTSWYGKLEKAFKVSFKQGLEVLSERPGEYVRRLDALVRKNPQHLNDIMDSFKVAVGKTSNKVLFEVYSHFLERESQKTGRHVFVKGARRPIPLPNLPALNKKTIDVIIENVFEALGTKFSTLESLGNCWIDEELKKIPLPTNMRTADFSLRPTIRGQRTAIGNKDGKVLRAFCHWFDDNGSQDPDLSATFIGENGRVSVISYSGRYLGQSVHSGDIIARRGACAEYVDIHVADALKQGYRYVSIDVRNYRGGTMKSLNAFAGIMVREFPESGTNWVPSTVEISQQLNSTATNTRTCIIDLETMEYIHLDIDAAQAANTARGDINGTMEMVKKYAETPKFSVYDLILLHVQNRGRQVTTEENIDTYFRLEDFIHSYEETGKLMGI